VTHGAGELRSAKNVKNNILDVNSQWHSWVYSLGGGTSHRAVGSTVRVVALVTEQLGLQLGWWH